MIFAVNEILSDDEREQVRQTIVDNSDDAQLHDSRIVHVRHARRASEGGGPYYCVWCDSPVMSLWPRRDRHSGGLTFYHSDKPNCITIGRYKRRDTA